MNGKALGAAFVAAFRERLRYPGDVVGFAGFLVLLLFVFTRLWTAAAQRGDLGDWTPARLVLYLLVTELVTLSPGWVHQGIASRVRSGDLVTDLLRPVDWVAWEVSSAAGSAAVRLLVLAVAGMPALVLLTGMPRIDPRGLLVGALVLVPLAVLLDCCVRILIGLLAFWFEEATPFYWIWQKLAFTLGGLMLPLDLYPDWLRTAASCLPFSALLFQPARAVVAFDAAQAWGAAATLAGWLLVAWLSLVLAFGRASRRLQLNGG